MHQLLAILLGFHLAVIVPVLPKDAGIVPSKESRGNDAIGNVKVLFTDGHFEMWTKLGTATMPKVGETGLVGWVTFSMRNDRGWPVTDTLRICWPPDGRHKDFKTTSKPFIDAWDFADHDTTVIIKSRGAHGPAEFLRYRLATGELLDEIDAGMATSLPNWAQPYADN